MPDLILADKANFSLPKWEKKGLVFQQEQSSFFKSHTTRPIPFFIDDSTLRIYFFSRCEQDTMHPTFIDVNPENPSEIKYISEVPILGLGDPGCFDDSGVSPGSIISSGGKNLVYYTGWKRRRLVNFEFSIGVAELQADYFSMTRLYKGPVLSQDINHPILVGGPYVLKNEGAFKMWYCSGERWIFPEHGPEPLYSVYYAESINGIDWSPQKAPLLKKGFDDEVITAPWVEQFDSHWLMWYSYRGAKTRERKNYKIGVAISSDGKNWHRRDNESGISLSSSGWDSEMICYPSFYSIRGKTIMLYCGNNVGKGGIGWAISSYPLSTQITR